MLYFNIFSLYIKYIIQFLIYIFKLNLLDIGEIIEL